MNIVSWSFGFNSLNMTKLQIQFHATTLEIIDFLNACIRGLNLNAAFVCEPPFTSKPILGQIPLAEVLSPGEGAVVRVLLLSRPFCFGASSFDKFLDANHGASILHLGRLTANGLEESALSFYSDRADDLVLAKKLASKLKAITTAGVVAFDPISGSEARIRGHRYSLGAKEAYGDGVRILPVAGRSLFRLE